MRALVNEIQLNSTITFWLADACLVRDATFQNTEIISEERPQAATRHLNGNLDVCSSKNSSRTVKNGADL